MFEALGVFKDIDEIIQEFIDSDPEDTRIGDIIALNEPILEQAKIDSVRVAEILELIRADFIKKAGSEEKSIKQKILEENYCLFSDLEEIFVNEQIRLLQTGEGNKFIDKLRPLSKSVNEIVGAVIISAFTECLAKIIVEKKREL